MENEIRRLERLALDGDYESRRRLHRALVRAGYLDPDQEELEAPQTEAEVAQDHYDDLWWHGNTGLKCGLWGGTSRWRFFDVDFNKSIFKAHHYWGHKWAPYRGKAKRTTLRTFRDGSHG